MSVISDVMSLHLSPNHFFAFGIQHSPSPPHAHTRTATDQLFVGGDEVLQLGLLRVDLAGEFRVFRGQVGHLLLQILHERVQLRPLAGQLRKLLLQRICAHKMRDRTSE